MTWAWIVGSVIVGVLQGILVAAITAVAVSRRVKALHGSIARIEGQFHGDSGTSLRDVANRLERSAEDSRSVARTLSSAIAVLAEQVQAGADTGLRIEGQAEGVAVRLHDSQVRADAVDPEADPGEASDAASRGPS